MKCPHCNHNLLEDAEIVYDRILAIEAEKGSHSNFKGELYRHDFKKSGSVVYGLKNGCLLIVNKKGKRLWKKFNY